MKAINQFIFETLLFIVLIMGLIIVIIGSYYVIKTMIKEWLGYTVDIFKRRKQ